MCSLTGTRLLIVWYFSNRGKLIDGFEPIQKTQTKKTAIDTIFDYIILSLCVFYKCEKSMRNIGINVGIDKK